MQTVVLITDGSADNRNGSGGWAAIVRGPDILIELFGYADGTTSNRMELVAIIEGLKAIKTPSRVEIVADSAYALNSIRDKWYERWIKQAEHDQWLYGKHKPRPNLDLWRQLQGLCQFHEVVPIKVKGHSGDYWNTRADRLADRARREKLSETHTLLGIPDARCDDIAPSGRRCKLHLGHTGPHYWSEGKKNGIEPYAAVELSV